MQWFIQANQKTSSSPLLTNIDVNPSIIRWYSECKRYVAIDTGFKQTERSVVYTIFPRRAKMGVRATGGLSGKVGAKLSVPGRGVTMPLWPGGGVEPLSRIDHTD